MASFSDWTKKKKEEQKSTGKAMTVQPSSASSAPSFSDWTTRRRASELRDSILSGNVPETNEAFNSWMDNLTSFSNRMASASKERESRYQSADALDEYRRSTGADISSMLSQASTYSSYFDRYRDVYDELYGEGTIESMLEGLSQGSDYLKSTKSGLDSEYDYWSQWETEEDYNSYLEQIKEYERLSGYDVAGGRSNLEVLEAQLEGAGRERDRARAVLSEHSYDETGAAGEMGQAAKDYIAQSNRYSELRHQMSALQRELKQAEDIQTANRYNAYLSKPDFSAYSEAGAAIENPSLKDAEKGVSLFGWNPFGEKPGNIVTYSRDNWERIALGEANNSQMTGRSLYHWMTDDEVNIYNYLLAKDGQEAAQEYLGHLEETLNYRFGTRQAENIQEMGGIGEGVFTGLYSVGAGLDQFASGARQLFSSERLPTTATQYGSAALREDLSGVGGVLYDIGTVAGNMAPSILLSALTAGLGAPGAVAGGVGSATLGASAGGNAYNQALAEGYTQEQARSYGILIGASEGALQYVLGGIGALGGVSGKLAAKVAAIDGAAARVALSLGGRMAAEGLEEGLQEILAPVFRTVIFDEELDISFADAAYAAMLGALTAGILEAPGLVLNGVPGDRLAVREFGADIDGYLGADGIDYFEGINNADTLQKTYRDLAKQNHPDVGGTEQTMSDISRQYAMKKAFLSAQQAAQSAGPDTVYSGPAAGDASAAESADIAKTLRNEGVNESKAATLAASIRNIVNGEDISGNAAAAIAQSREAVSVLSELVGVPIDTDAPLSEVKAAIRALASRTGGTAEQAPASDTATPTAAQERIRRGYESMGNRTAAVQAYEAERISDIADTLGPAGAKVLTSMYDPATQEAAAYFQSMASYYNAGTSGADASSVRAEAADTLTKAQAEAAYMAGQADAAGNKEMEVMNHVGEESGAGDEGGSGGGERSYRVAAAEPGAGVSGGAEEAQTGPETQRRRAESIRAAAKAQGIVSESTAGQGISSGTTNKTIQVIPSSLWTGEMRAAAGEHRAAGRQVVFFTGELELSGGAGETFRARGAVSKDGKRVWIRADHDTLTVEQISKHEEFHARVKSDKDLMRRVRDRLVAERSEAELLDMSNAYIDWYGWTDVSVDYVLEEVLADAYAGIDVFEELSSYEGATRFTDSVRDETNKETAAAIDRTTGPPAEVETFSINPSFADEIDRWDGKSRKGFRVGTTSDALQRIGVYDRGIIWHSRKIGEILQKHSGMTRDIIKQVPDILENPIIVLKSRQSNSRLSIFGEVTDKNGAPVTAILELHPTTKGGELLNMNVIASAYGKDNNLTGFIENSDVLYLDENKNRTESWMQSFGLRLPSDANAFGPIGNIAYLDGSVKIEGVPYRQLMQDGPGDIQEKFSMERPQRDSEGRELTAEQAEFFKDSKVRDENGDLLVVYHGTDSDFNIFDMDRGFYSLISYAMYFTTDEAKASAYADKNNTTGRVIKAYLNIKNPVNFADAKNQLRLIPSTVKDKYRAEFDVDEIATKTNYAIINFAQFVADQENKTQKSVLEEWGFDGSVDAKDYAAFSPEQIKSTDNLNPTTDPDIRFSREAPAKDDMAKWTPERIDRLYDKYAASSPNYSKAYATYISPDDFLSLTTARLERIESESSALDIDRLGAEIQEIFLVYDPSEPDEVSGHEGRHRMVALRNAGVKQVPIVVQFRGEKGKQNRQPIESLTLRGEEFAHGRAPGNVTLSDLVPISKAYRSEIEAKFGNVDTDSVAFSRDADSIKDLREQTEALQDKVDYWKGQTKRTQRQTLRQGDIEKLARDIIKGYDSELKASDISAELKSLGEYIVNNGEENGDELHFGEVKRRAVAVARDVIQSASVLTNGADVQTYKDIRAYLRGTRIAYTDRGDIADYKGFLQRNFGRMRIAKDGLPVDVAYAELTETFGEGYFPSDISHPGDQLMHISDLLDGMVPIYDNPHSYYMAEAIEYAANDIIDRLLSESVRQAPPTFADRQAAKLDAQKAEGRRQLDSLREQKNERIEEIKLKGRERAKKAAERERARRLDQVSSLKEHYRKLAQAKRERVADSNARSRLLKIAKRLQNKKLPAVSRALLEQYIGELDTTAKSMTGRTLEKLSDLRDWYEDQRDNNPDFISDPRVERALSRLYKKQISQLTAEEVAELTDVLLNIENELRTQKKLIDSAEKRNVYNMGVQVIRDVEDSRGSGEGGIAGALDKYIVTETLSPTRQVRRMTGYVDDDPLYILTNELADGQRAMFDYQRRANERFKQFTEDKAFVKDISGKDAKTIKIAGIGKDGPMTVTITPAMRMSLYLHSLNDQNMRHIAGGGITIPDMKLYKQGKISEAYARGETIKLTPSQVRSIAAGMTGKGRAFARAAHDYFNGMSQGEINAVSEKLKGFSIAGVEDYFPINTDTAFTKSNFESIKYDGSIEGMGIFKERINASNPIMLRDLNSVLIQSIDQHAKYIGLAIPIRNFNKVWGVTKGSFNEDGSRNNFESSVQKAVKNKWGDAGYDYIEKMMADLNGMRKPMSKWAKVFSKVRSNYAVAVLTLNASVAMKQAASYPTAGAVIGFKPLARAMADFGKVDLNLIAKYTPLQWYRTQGFSTQELGDMAKQGKSLPKLLNWVQGIDLITTRKLWKAAEYYVRAAERSLPVGTEEYYKAVADIYNQVIEETQPNYTTMQRPQLLRSDDTLMQNLVMFKTQPFQNFNILYDALGNMEAKKTAYQNSGTEDSRKNFEKAKTRTGWAVVSQLMQLAVFAGMSFAWLIYRGKKGKYEDEDGQMTIPSALAGIGKDMVGGALSGVPFGSDVWELASRLIFGDTYYGFDAVTASAINDLGNAFVKAGTALSGIWQGVLDPEAEIDWNEQRLKFDSVIDAASKVSGAPYKNVANLFNATYRWAAIAVSGKYLGGYAALKLTTSPSTYASDYYDLLYGAYKNDQEAYEKIYADMIETERFTAEKIKNAMENREKAAQGVNSVKDLESRYLPPGMEAEYTSSLSEIEGSSLWRSASGEQRDTLESSLYDLIIGNSEGTKMQEKIDGGAVYGLSETDYLLYKLALSMTDQPTESGKYGSYTNDEVEAAIRMLTGISDEAKGYLWETQGKSDTNNPWP